MAPLIKCRLLSIMNVICTGYESESWLRVYNSSSCLTGSASDTRFAVLIDKIASCEPLFGVSHVVNIAAIYADGINVRGRQKIFWLSNPRQRVLLCTTSRQLQHRNYYNLIINLKIFSRTYRFDKVPSAITTSIEEWNTMRSITSGSRKSMSSMPALRKELSITIPFFLEEFGFRFKLIRS